MAVDITPAKDGGVLKEILKEGTGTKTPQVASRVKVHYTGTLLDGTKFDSSRDRNQPFEFELGQSQVIKAWDIGIATMKKGEVAVLTCAPEYAYGKPGSPPAIPPNSTLKFEVEMIDWVGEDLSPDKDEGITREQIQAGEGYAIPNEGALVDIHLTGYYNGTVFEDRDVKFTIGEGEAEGIVLGVETALLKFKKGEISKVCVKSKYAFGAAGKPEYNVPPNADVEFIVEMKNFEKAPDSWSLTGSQKIEQAKMFKDKGTSYFKDGKYSLAIKMYQKVIEYTNDDYDFKEKKELAKMRDDLLLSANLNLSLCFLKTNQPFEAKESCNKSLELDPKNEKALFRRGQAHLELAAPELAIKDFQAVVAIEPKNTAAAKQIIVCNNLIKKDLAKEKKLYANMFEKFAKEDQQKLEEELSKLPDVMHGTLGEWGQEERPGGRDATAFEKENPNILMLNANGTGEFKNM
ncbi:hypothetical protein TSAR_001033 [Trichomalopsis sarcophagae]|uniref:peptidylprolyl isomerase n=1 Tax=Trichomalopsis sarcophagae TaxID=543379 RepID=A0A232FL83_9HYME|nr:hypothetical protein TSAR_001033 [Trichomalopsis sarcophagae]